MPQGICEDCLEQDTVYDAVCDGKLMKLCDRCIQANFALKLTFKREEAEKAKVSAKCLPAKPTKLDFSLEATKRLKIKDLIELSKKGQE